jgi:hypothetical protein
MFLFNKAAKGVHADNRAAWYGHGSGNGIPQVFGSRTADEHQKTGGIAEIAAQHHGRHARDRRLRHVAIRESDVAHIHAAYTGQYRRRLSAGQSEPGVAVLPR